MSPSDPAGRTRAAARPTLAQVAAVARVSPKTASRALNGEPNVAKGTLTRVQEAADLLGFRLNGIARELRRGATSRLVGLISGDLANPLYSAVASGIEREIRHHGLQLVTASNDEDAEQEHALIDAFIERRVRALLVVSTADQHDHLAIERRRGVPFVFVDRPPVGLSADTVLLDSRGGARAAANHLLAAGHRRIAVVGDLARLPTQRERVEGFVEAMSAAGNGEWKPFLCTDVHDVAGSETAVRELLAASSPPTALFTLNNRLTTGALRALKGRRPRTALIGFDDFELADVLDVSVVAHDAEAMGRTAAQLALDRMAGRGGRPRTVVLPTRVIPRGSGELNPP
jgi:LacI family transcriptional regulator